MSLVIGAINQRYIFQENRFGEDTCAICQGRFWLCNRITRMPCGHIIHRDCFNEYVATQLRVLERGFPREGRQVVCIFCRAPFPIDVAAIDRLEQVLPRYAALYTKSRYDQIRKMEREELLPGDADKAEALLKIILPEIDSFQWQATKIYLKAISAMLVGGCLGLLAGKYL